MKNIPEVFKPSTDKNKWISTSIPKPENIKDGVWDGKGGWRERIKISESEIQSIHKAVKRSVALEALLTGRPRIGVARAILALINPDSFELPPK